MIGAVLRLVAVIGKLGNFYRVPFPVAVYRHIEGVASGGKCNSYRLCQDEFDVLVEVGIFVGVLSLFALTGRAPPPEKVPFGDERRA